MSDQPKPTEWTVGPVQKLDGTLWSEIAYIVEPSGRKHGSVNERVAIGLVKSINAALAAATARELHSYDVAKQCRDELAAEREKVELLSKSRVAVDQAELLSLREKVVDMERTLAAEREKREEAVNIAAATQVELDGADKVIANYKAWLAAEQSKVQTLVDALKEMETKHGYMPEVLRSIRVALAKVGTYPLLK